LAHLEAILGNAIAQQSRNLEVQQNQTAFEHAGSGLGITRASQDF
jgi:hypothetical protein